MVSYLQKAAFSSFDSMYRLASKRHRDIGGCSNPQSQAWMHAAKLHLAVALTASQAALVNLAMFPFHAATPGFLGYSATCSSHSLVCMLQTAIQLWPQLQATGLPLVSPAVASNADVSGSWLDQFMASAASDGLRVDYIGLHWSGSDFDTATAVSQLQQYIQAVYRRYNRPIWLTQVSKRCADNCS